MTGPTDNEIPAGLARRLAALVYDMLLLFGVLFIASLFVIPLGITQDHALYPGYLLYIYGVTFCFFAWFWTHGGQTLGMKTWHIKLIKQNETKLSWKDALQRFGGALLFWLPAIAGHQLFPNSLKLLWWIYLLPIVVNYVWSLVNVKRMSLLDLLSSTQFVKE